MMGELRRRGGTGGVAAGGVGVGAGTGSGGGQISMTLSEENTSYDDVQSRKEETKTKTSEDSSFASPTSNDGNGNQIKTLETENTVSWIVTKWIILRMVGIMYFIAFLGAYYQNRGLMGSNGLVPAEKFYNSMKQQYSNNDGSDLMDTWEGFKQYPSIFWWIDMTDDRLEMLYITGMVLSSLVVVVLQEDSMIVMFILWLLYFSIVTAATGNSFYAYGWESQMLETGFLSMFLCDVFPTFIYSPSSYYYPLRKFIFPTTKNPKTTATNSTTNKTKTSISNLTSPPSSIILWLFRWLSFRISIGAGLIKIRGDSCWTDKTCLHYHFETQPIPSPLSFIFHFLPKWMLTHAVDLDLFVQVYTSWMVLPIIIPKPSTLHDDGHDSTRSNNNHNANKYRYFLYKVHMFLHRMSLYTVRLGGFIQICFMINILLSGNFAFLNHLTIIPSIACLDDACLSFWPIFPWLRRRRQEQEQQQQKPQHYLVSYNRGNGKYNSRNLLSLGRDLFLLYLYTTLSWPVIENLLQLSGKRQQMNASFDTFRLVNTYGAFGSVGQKRYEPIIFITYGKNNNGTTSSANTSTDTNDDDDNIGWIELEFPCKPGTVTRRPCFCAPYHYRIDWNIWFIGFKPHQAYLQRREQWMFEFISKLLTMDAIEEKDGQGQQQGEQPWLNLLDDTSVHLLQKQYNIHNHGPIAVKVDMYHYQMAGPLWDILPTYIFQQLQKRFDDTDKNRDKNQVVWWNRTFEEELIPPVEYNQQYNRLVRSSKI